MPLYHCSQCHHEFEGVKTTKLTPILCDWCGAPSYILEERTPLEKMCDDGIISKLLDKLRRKNESI